MSPLVFSARPGIVLRMNPPLPHADHPRVHALNLAFDTALARCSAAADPAVARARRWSALAHADQLRPDGSGTPYAAHPLSVAARVASWWPDAPAAVLAAALLHDTLEDQAQAVLGLARAEGFAADAPEAGLAAAFGAEVLRLVQALTSPSFDGPADAKNAAYCARVVHTVVHDPAAGVVKLSDFYDNALALHAVSDPHKRAKLSAKYRPVVVALAEAIGALEAPHPLAAVREARVAELRAALAAWPD